MKNRLSNHFLLPPPALPTHAAPSVSRNKAKHSNDDWGWNEKIRTTTKRTKKRIFLHYNFWNAFFHAYMRNVKMNLARRFTIWYARRCQRWYLMMRCKGELLLVSKLESLFQSPGLGKRALDGTICQQQLADSSAHFHFHLVVIWWKRIAHKKLTGGMSWKM